MHLTKLFILILVFATITSLEAARRRKKHRSKSRAKKEVKATDKDDPTTEAPTSADTATSGADEATTEATTQSATERTDSSELRKSRNSYKDQEVEPESLRRAPAEAGAADQAGRSRTVYPPCPGHCRPRHKPLLLPRLLYSMPAVRHAPPPPPPPPPAHYRYRHVHGR